jgi:hypothetical protein
MVSRKVSILPRFFLHLHYFICYIFNIFLKNKKIFFKKLSVFSDRKVCIYNEYWNCGATQIAHSHCRQRNETISDCPLTAATVVMETAFVIDRLREFLGPTGNPQLRLVSRSFRDALAAVPLELLRVEAYLSSASLFLWASLELRMPERADIADMAARGGHLAVLIWLQAEEGRCSWTPSICKNAAEEGHLHVLISTNKLAASPEPSLSLGRRVLRCGCDSRSS